MMHQARFSLSLCIISHLSRSGGNVKIISGSTQASSNRLRQNNDHSTGGSVEIASGASHSSSSGEISISTANAGTKGTSGYLRIQTGQATSGTAGYIGKNLKQVVYCILKHSL